MSSTTTKELSPAAVKKWSDLDVGPPPSDDGPVDVAYMPLMLVIGFHTNDPIFSPVRCRITIKGKLYWLKCAILTYDAKTGNCEVAPVGGNNYRVCSSSGEVEKFRVKATDIYGWCQ